jgi:tetratricopeptide (TPR) repeat protein
LAPFSVRPKKRKRQLGENHPDTLATLTNLGVNYRDAGRLDEGIQALEEAYRKGQNYPKLAWVRGELLAAYIKAHKQPAAVALIREQLTRSRKTLPAESAQLGAALATLGSQLLELQAFTEAESLLRECLAIRTKLAPEAWNTSNAKSMLGGALLGQKNYIEAEPLLLAGYEGLKTTEKSIPPQAKNNIPEAVQRIVDLYEATGKKENASTWRKKLEETKKP